VKKRRDFEYFNAPAKLNLMLRVNGVRNDRYHMLQTVFHLINYSDSIGIRLIEQCKVRRVSRHAWPEEDDLVVRAARLLANECSVKQGVELDVLKQIPDGAGLGGGSSNAATVLIVLNKLWGLNLRRQELQNLSIALGADVPFFVFGQNAFAEGIGDELTPLVLPEVWYLVIYPNIAVSTSSVFSNPQLTRNSKPIKIADFSSYEGQNDLQETVCRSYPQVRLALGWLGQFGSAAMSGSGSSVYSTFADQTLADSVLAKMPDCWTGFVARGLGKHPLYDWVEN